LQFPSSSPDLSNSALRLTALWAGFLLALPASTQGQGGGIQLSIAPLRVEYNLNPSSLQTEAIRISNDGDDPSHLAVTTNDWTLSSGGTPDFLNPTAPPPDEFSCGSWITLNPAEFDLPPHSFQIVRFTIRVPAGVRPGGYRTAILFSTVPSPLQLTRDQKAIRTRVRLATVVYVKIGNPEVRGTIAGMELAPGSPGPHDEPDKPTWEIRVPVRNEGTTYFRANGDVKLLGENGQELDDFKIESQVVLPASTRVFVFKHAGDLPPGSYGLTCTMDIGMPAVLQSERHLTIQAPAAPPEEQKRN
jgi:hypothetical protein